MFSTGDSIVSSTPNLVQENGDSATLERPDSKHFYTNAAPTKIEGNVFRYDFFDPPIVNRNLKPKLSTEKIPTNGYGMIRALPPSPIAVGAPTVDRKLKPAIAAKVHYILIFQFSFSNGNFICSLQCQPIRCIARDLARYLYRKRTIFNIHQTNLL